VGGDIFHVKHCRIDKWSNGGSCCYEWEEWGPYHGISAPLNKTYMCQLQERKIEAIIEYTLHYIRDKFVSKPNVPTKLKLYIFNIISLLCLWTPE